MSALDTIHQKKREQGKGAMSANEEAILTLEECGYTSLAGDAAKHLVRLIDQNQRLIEWHMEQGRIIHELRQKLASQNAVIDAARVALNEITIGFIGSKEMRILARDALDGMKEQK